MPKTRHPERQAALARIRTALANGTMTKPELCEQCGEPPSFNSRRKVRGLVAIFLNGYEDWKNPTWVCYKCHDSHIDKPRRGAWPTGAEADQHHKSPPYEKMRHMLVVEGYTYRQIAAMHGIASIPSLQETFKRRAIRRNDWPIPELKSKARSEKIIKRGTSILASGVAADINAFLRETAMTPRQFADMARVDHEWLNSVLRGQFKRILFKSYDRLERALNRGRVEYTDFQTRSDKTRADLIWLMEYTRRGRVRVANDLHWNPHSIDPFLHGRLLPKERLEAVEEKIVKPWMAEVEEQNRIRERVKACFDPRTEGGQIAYVSDIRTNRLWLLRYIDGAFMHPSTFARLVRTLPTWEQRYAIFKVESERKSALRDRLNDKLVVRAQISERTFAGVGKLLDVDSDRIRRFCKGSDVAVDMELATRLDRMLDGWDRADVMKELTARAELLIAGARQSLCDDLRVRFLRLMDPWSPGRSVRAIWRSGACSQHKAKYFLDGNYTVNDDELRSLIDLLEKWEADDGVSANAI